MIPQTDKSGKIFRPCAALFRLFGVLSGLLSEHGICTTNHHYDKWRQAMAAFPLPRRGSWGGRALGCWRAKVEVWEGARWNLRGTALEFEGVFPGF